MASITTFFGTQGGGGISGSGSPGQIAYFDGSSSITSQSLLAYDDSTGIMTVGASSGGNARLNVFGFGSGASATGKGLTVADVNAIEVFAIGDNGRIYANATKADESLSGNVIIGDEFTGQSVATLSGSVIAGAGAAKNATGGATSVILGKGAYQTRGGGSQPVNNPTDCIVIGREAKSGANTSTVSNEIVIGAGALGGGSNTVTIGNSATTDVFLSGSSSLYVNNELHANKIRVGTGGIEPSNADGFKIGNQAADKLAFFGDTPNVQPDTLITGASVVHIGGAAVGASDTFGGYTIAQIAAALIRLGLLA